MNVKTISHMRLRESEFFLGSSLASVVLWNNAQKLSSAAHRAKVIVQSRC